MFKDKKLRIIPPPERVIDTAFSGKFNINRCPEGKKTGEQTHIVILNLFDCFCQNLLILCKMSGFPQDLINGRLEDRKVRRYAVIGEHSSHGICHCEGVKRPSQSHNIIEPHPSPLLEKEREKRNVLSPRERVRERAYFGSSEGRKARGQASIGEQSSRNNKFLPFIGKVRMGFKQSLLTLTLSRRGRGKHIRVLSRAKVNSPERGNNINFPKRTCSPIDLFTSSLKEKVAFTLAEGATRVALPNSQHRAAFTLAEVLITLGIIGVVAAMTLPTLIANKNKQDTVVKVKKIYSTLAQAHLRAIEEYGDFAYWDDGFEIGAEAYFNKYYKPYLNTIKICNDVYCGYDTSSPWETANGETWTYSVYVNGSYRAPCVLSDGTIAVFSVKAGPEGVSRNNFIYFDINGNAKPNKLGRDTFVFVRENGGIKPYGYNYNDDEINSNCSKEGSGEYCAAKMMRDGWQIKDGYPW